MPNLAYLTEFDLKTFNPKHCPRDKLGHWGKCHRIYRALNHPKTPIFPVGNLNKTREHTAIIPKLKRRVYQNLFKTQYLPWTEPEFNREYARQFQEKLNRLNRNIDIILTSDSNLIAYLDSPKPFAIWTDTPYAGLINFYPNYQNLCRETQNQLYQMDKLALNKCQWIFFASNWAANIAIKTYQLPPQKIHIVPFGANFDFNPKFEDVEAAIASRPPTPSPQTPCKLLFLGVNWIRKGGNLALQVAKTLNRNGIPTELTIAGCRPPTDEPLPDFVRCVGFLDRTLEIDRQTLHRHFAESHFLILPSTAECYGHVFCEANGFGVPCLASNVGGIPTVIRDGINGKTFPRHASPSDYCNFIAEVFSTPDSYRHFALSAFKEYQTRLNWDVAAKRVREILIRR
ncbi:glycosyltransferase family 4 protein [Baaleninema sp.]|uniref:glycosyltransferase family 4 protein n=1 Tax=Baaleninema sp. TaxID=3101197 RepID=UPI003D077B74